MALAAATCPAPAGAEVGAGPYPTSQAIAADARFLEYAPPPAKPGVVCLVDSGVDPNPDTNAAVVGSEAEVTSWGTGDGLAQVQPRVEGHPAGHGTEMAMLMAAPQNGWGMVGIAPTSVRVYSIRVLRPGQSTFPFSAYTVAINRCLKLGLTTVPGINVISLSLGGTATPSDSDLAFLEESVDSARQHGISVVAAAGNEPGTTASYPAAYSSVLAVGAGDAAQGNLGVLCGFSNRTGLDVIAPGCNSVTGGVDEAFADDGTPATGFGTSQAAAVSSAVLAAMHAYAPSLSAAEVELCMTATEQNGGNLDVAAAFKACGLESVVEAGLASVPSVPAAPETAGSPPGGETVAGSTRTRTVPQRLTTPHLTLRVRPGKVTLSVLNRPTGALVQVKLFAKRGRRLVVLGSRRFASRSITFTVRAAHSIEARFVLPGRVVRTSRWITKVIG